MSCDKSSRRVFQAGHGFTLIELLVVISLIAILISLLIPALGHARERAREVICASQLRQWGTAIAAYAADNDGQLLMSAQPPWLNFHRPQIIWNRSIDPGNYADELNAQAINPYIGAPVGLDQGTVTQVAADSVLYCPSTDRGFQASWSKSQMNNLGHGRMSYSYFAQVSKWTQGLRNGAETELVDGDLWDDPELLLMSDALRWHPFSAAFWSNHTALGWNTDFTSESNDSGLIQGLNHLYADGHATWLDGSSMETERMVNGDAAPVPVDPWIKIDRFGGVMFYR